MPTGASFAARRLQPVPIEEPAISGPALEPDLQPRGDDIEALLLQALRVGVGACIVSAAITADIARRTLGIDRDPHEEAGEPPLGALLAGAALGIAVEGVSRTTAAAVRTVQTIAPWGSWVLSATGVRGGAIRSMERLNERWRGYAPDAEDAATAFMRELVPEIATALLDQIDLSAMIEEHVDVDRIVSSVDLEAIVSRVDVDAIVDHVDLDAVASRLDLDALVARVDLDAVVRRLDLAAIAREVIDELDLPGLIRDSSEGVTAEAVDDLRYGTVEADRAVARLVDRVLRRGGHPAEPPAPTGAGTETP